jgi:hypothetical protein
LAGAAPVTIGAPKGPAGQCHPDDPASLATEPASCPPSSAAGCPPSELEAPELDEPDCVAASAPDPDEPPLLPLLPPLPLLLAPPVPLDDPELEEPEELAPSTAPESPPDASCPPVDAQEPADALAITLKSAVATLGRM